MLPATIVMNARRPIIGRSRRLALAGLRLFTPSPSPKAGGWRRHCMWGARVELTAAPKLCRQSAVVGECRIDVHHEVTGLISHRRSYAATPLALHDQATAAEHDLAPSARLTDRSAGHEVIRAVLSDRQLDIVRLGAWFVHDALPRTSHGLDVGHHDGRNRADASATGQRGDESEYNGHGDNGPDRTSAVGCHRFSPLAPSEEGGPTLERFHG